MLHTSQYGCFSKIFLCKVFSGMRVILNCEKLGLTACLVRLLSSLLRVSFLTLFHISRLVLSSFYLMSPVARSNSVIYLFVASIFINASHPLFPGCFVVYISIYNLVILTYCHLSCCNSCFLPDQSELHNKSCLYFEASW